MSGRSPFSRRLGDAIERAGPLCVGIDPRPPFPDEVMRGLQGTRSGGARAMERYAIGLVDAVAPYAAAVKPQVAFFELYGGYGLHALDAVCARAREHGLLVIADAKRGDIASTAAAYAEAWIGVRPGEAAPLADAVTVAPYMGRDSIDPFLEVAQREHAGLYLLARTSNPGAADLEERPLADGPAVWEAVAGWIDSWSRADGHPGAVGAVIGATAPAALARARALMPDAPLLLPGLGAQGGRPEDLRGVLTNPPGNALAVAARSVIEAWRDQDGLWTTAVAEAARRHRESLLVSAGPV
jgi:orotidine-5'-phosphate decarboxylase